MDSTGEKLYKQIHEIYPVPEAPYLTPGNWGILRRLQDQMSTTSS